MRRVLLPLGGVVALLVMLGPSVIADDNDEFSARMSGYQETPQTLSTAASGRIRIEIDDDQIEFRMSYSGLEGTVLFAHIHFGAPDTTGGVSAFLCGGGSKPDPCPQSGTVSGTITAADVIGPTGQGIEPGAIGELIQAMRAGVTYANIHSSKWPGGELRGNLQGDDD